MKRPFLLPLVPLYATGVWLARRFAPQPRRLNHPVVSIGSLSAGGAGKTPVVAALAALLTRHGYTVDVLSRGYGRASRAVERVDPTGTASRYGDEPILLARLGLPVYVGADRHTAGTLAEAELSGPNPIHLLDDGFQHRRLARALDLLLLTREDAADTLLPAGNLREPLRRLRRADAVIVRDEEAAYLMPLVHRLAPGVPLWLIERQLQLDAPPARPLVFSGIARPQGFLDMLAAAGIRAAGHLSFPDHHAYPPRSIFSLLTEAKRWHADGFITTEKDAVKLTGPLRAELQAAGPLTVARLQVHWLDEASILAAIAEACRRCTP